jgi:F420H(2)-dependent biliverdin reductase
VSAPLAQLSVAGLQFVRDRHLATFTSLRADGNPHVTPVGFTWDAQRGLARVITSGTSRKARNAALGGAVVLCQFDGRRWLALEGTSRVTADPAEVAEAVARYAERYRVPRDNPARVAIEIRVTRFLGSAEFLNN